MTDDDPEIESAVTPVDNDTESTDPTAVDTEAATDDGGDEIPEVTNDEKAEVPSELAEKMTASRDAETDDPGDGGGEPHDSEGSESDDKGGSEGGDDQRPSGSIDESSSYNWGDVYVDGLGIFLLEISAELDGEDPDMTEDDIRSLATSGPVDLPQAFDEMINEMGMNDEMSPMQATVTGSAMLAFAVLMKETDAAGQMVGKFSEAAEVGGEA
ncbi:hypothetical protein BRC71_06300 [Halobacteriales archaeon QH_7_65_31]|nr:MAG: hypothetical protein BRC71_06300 [Halobacteriales archaeon QH_7_65_31]